MKNSYVTPIIIVVVAVLAGLLYFNRQSLGSVVNNQPILNENSNPTSVPTVSGNVKEYLINGQNYRFSPTEIKVNQGDNVKITFKNTEGNHDWKLDEFNAKTPVISAGQESSVTFTADKKGTFEYYCSVDGHRQMGMVGKFIVE